MCVNERFMGLKETTIVVLLKTLVGLYEILVWQRSTLQDVPEAADVQNWPKPAHTVNTAEHFSFS